MQVIEIRQHNAGHMTKMAAMPIYGKNTLKIFFAGTTGPILMKLCKKHQRPKPIHFIQIIKIIIIIMTLFKEDYSVGQVQSSLRSSIKIHTFTIYTYVS